MSRTPAGEHTNVIEDDEVGSDSQARTAPKRINVAVNPETVKALEALIEREGVSLTEAVRRLVGYGDFLYRAVKDDNAVVLLKTADGTRELILL